MAKDEALSFNELMDDLGNPDLLTPSQYHNVALDARRIHGVRYALAMAERGAKLFPRDPDLLADCLAFSPTDVTYPNELWSYAEHYYRELNQIGAFRNWRAYDFAIDYLIDRRILTENEDEARGTAREALELSAAYIRALPTDGRSYSARIKVLQYMEDHEIARHGDERDHSFDLGMVSASDNSEAMLRKLTFNQDIKDRLPVPACCMAYADLLLERGNYARARDAALQGLRDSTQAQPGIRTGYLVYVYALCTDALLFDALNSKNQTSDWLTNGAANELRDDAAKLMAVYKTALRMLGGSSYYNEIEQRMSVLSAIFGVAEEVELDSEEAASLNQLLKSVRHAGDINGLESAFPQQSTLPRSASHY